MRRVKGLVLLIVADLVSLNLALVVAHWLAFHIGLGGPRRFYPLASYFPEPALVISVIWLLIFAFFGLYRLNRHPPFSDQFVTLFKATMIGGLFFFFVSYDPADPLPPTRVVMLTYGFILLTLVAGGRLVVDRVRRAVLSSGIGVTPCLIVGEGEPGRALYRQIQRSPELGLAVVGIIAEDAAAHPVLTPSAPPILGGLETLPEFVSQHRVEEVFIAMVQSSRERILEAVSRCPTTSVHFHIIPDLNDILSGYARGASLNGLSLVELWPERMPFWERNAKRIFDVLSSVAVLVGGAPVWLLVALAIKLDSRGPVFFRQKRVGKNGGEFTICKFRSMVADAERHVGPVWATENDERMTRVGRFLRKMRLDEVPQLWNILVGEMSLVGPRPERPYFVAKLEQEIPYYRQRLRVSPGVTGQAQVEHHYDRSVDDVREKLKWDLYYIENMSLRMDFKILLRTVNVVLRGRGAH